MFTRSILSACEWKSIPGWQSWIGAPSLTESKTIFKRRHERWFLWEEENLSDRKKGPKLITSELVHSIQHKKLSVRVLSGCPLSQVALISFPQAKQAKSLSCRIMVAATPSEFLISNGIIWRSNCDWKRKGLTNTMKYNITLVEISSGIATR